MAIGTVIWNFTEYVCYLCIIISTSITLFGIGTGTKPKEEGENSGLGRALGLLEKTVNEFNNTKTKSTPASRKKR